MEKISKVYDLNDADEPIKEIFGRVPSWIIRWGNTLIMVFFASLLSLSIVIKYPDTVVSVARLTSINPPMPVVPLISGKLVKLLAKEGQVVQPNDIIAFLDSRAKHEEIIELSIAVDSIQELVSQNKTEYVLTAFDTKYQNLGEVQQPYQSFMESLALFKQYLSKGYYLKKKSMLQDDRGYLEKLHARLLRQKEIQQEDLRLADTTFKMNQRLKEENVIGSLEYRNERSKYLSKAIVIQQIDVSLTSNESAEHEKLKEILQLENDIAQQKSAFSQALNTLKSQLNDWKGKYLLTAQVLGRVAFASFLQENQQLQIGRPICYINPDNTTYFAEMVIPQRNFGKVAIGQKVLLKFPSYPFQEFGSVTGNLGFISHISTDSGYLAKILLPRGLITSYQKQLQYREGLFAQGEIITKDMRFLEKIINNIIERVKT